MAGQDVHKDGPLVSTGSFENVVSSDVAHEPIEIIERSAPELPRPAEKVALYDQNTGKKGPNLGGTRRTVVTKVQKNRRRRFVMRLGVPLFKQGYTEAELVFYNGRCENVPGVIAEELMGHPNYEVL